LAKLSLWDRPVIGDLATIEVDDLAAGGDGVGRLAGKVCFVPSAAPGDRLRIRIVRESRDLIRGRVERIERPGPDRREPPCPLADRCGGCAWLHVGEAAQAAAKGRLLARAVGAPACAVRRPQLALGYRRVARLHFAPRRRGGGALGFFAAAGREVVGVARCPVLDPAIERALASIRDELLAAVGAPVELRAVAAAQGVAVAVASAAPLPPAFYAAAAALVPGTLAAVCATVDGVAARVAGPDRVTVEGGDGAPLAVPPSGFGQAHAEMNRALAATVAAWAAEAGGGRGLELFAGAGNLSVALAPRLAALATGELDRGACAAARENLAARGLAADVRSGEALAVYAERGAGAGLVVIDPPRTGHAQLAARLAGADHDALIYVSCDPATLRRDLGILARGGWTVARAEGFDMFPQTAHLEAAVLLARA